MTWRARLFSSGLIVACVLAPALPLQAQSRSERNEAREHFKRGRAYHDLGQYQDAAREYLAAYELSNKPKLLFNVAQAYWSAGDKRESDGVLREICGHGTEWPSCPDGQGANTPAPRRHRNRRGRSGEACQRSTGG